MAREESQHDLRGRTVFILNVRKRRGRGWSDPDPIPFTNSEDLERHLCDIIAHHLSELGERPRRRIIAHLEAKDYRAVVTTFRREQRDDPTAISVDFSWLERPAIIM